MFANLEFKSSGETPIESGETLVFLTDGIMEAEDSECNEYGVDRALGAAAPHGIHGDADCPLRSRPI